MITGFLEELVELIERLPSMVETELNCSRENELFYDLQIQRVRDSRDQLTKIYKTQNIPSDEQSSKLIQMVRDIYEQILKNTTSRTESMMEVKKQIEYYQGILTRELSQINGNGVDHYSSPLKPPGIQI
jgi:DNA repair exonuclease SbcCD ATPase subunit